jgi:hypothetical protein
MFLGKCYCPLVDTVLSIWCRRGPKQILLQTLLLAALLYFARDFISAALVWNTKVFLVVCIKSFILVLVSIATYLEKEIFVVILKRGTSVVCLLLSLWGCVCPSL